MYLEHFGLHEAPFRITPHTDFFFAGANRGATLDALIYAITNDEGIVKISGEVGSGKTMLCRMLMERLPQSVVVVYLANPSLSRTDILFALADELGIEIAEQSRSGIVMRSLQEHLVSLYAEGKQVVVLIDEAHAMPMETLEEIRLLSNLESNRHKLLQLVLFGQPELDTILARNDMRQLRERITQNFNLDPLLREDIEGYLDFRMRAAGYRGPNIFMPVAIKMIAQASAGLTRRINILADKALLASFASGTHQVGDREAKAAIKDADFRTVNAPKSKYSLLTGLIWAAGGALLALALVGLWQWMTAQRPPVEPVAATNAEIPKAEASLPPSVPSETSKDVPVADPTMPSLDKLLEESQPWLASVADNHWFIQLYTTNNASRPEAVEKLLGIVHASGVDMDKVRVYYASFGGRNRYGIIYGDFASMAEAREALDSLPVELKRNHPYVRPTKHLKIDDNT